MPEFEVGEHLVLKKGFPQRGDHVGTVVKTIREEISVRWSGPEASRADQVLGTRTRTRLASSAALPDWATRGNPCASCPSARWSLVSEMSAQSGRDTPS